MRSWIGLVVAVALLVASPVFAQSAPDISQSPVRSLMLGLSLMTLTIIGSLLLFMIGGGDRERRHYH